MKGRLAFVLLALTAVPALTGWPLDDLSTEVIQGLSWGWVLYGVWTHGILWSLCGGHVYGIIVSAAVWIALPVVFGGAAVSHLFNLLEIQSRDRAVMGSHYIGLLITMLAVIPLALGIVALIPFRQIEARLLTQIHGLSLPQKAVVMLLRVFNHLLFFIMPQLLEAIREEQQMQNRAPIGFKERVRQIVIQMIFLSVYAISSALHQIPMWAVEIARLPKKHQRRQRKSQ